MTPVLALLQRIRRYAPALVLVALALTSVGCFKPYTIVTQSSPSALAGVQAYAISYDYSQVQISDKRMSEQQWLDTREKDEHRQTYLETKDSINVGIVEGLTKRVANVQFAPGEAGPGAIQLHVTYLEWEEGVYAGVVAWPSKATVRISFKRDGVVVDEIQMHVEEASSLATPAPQQRFHTLGQRIGEYTARYILEAQ